MTPEPGTRDRWPHVGLAAIAVALTGIAIQLPSFNRSIVPLDEGHMAAVVIRMLDGELLYRDIDTGIFPGIYYLCAGLFSAFESDLLITRWAQLVLNVAIAGMMWAIGQRAARPAFALLPPALYLGLVAVGFPVLTMFNYSALSCGFAMLALLLLLRYLEQDRWQRGVLCGIALAGCALSKQNYGALALLAVALAFLANRSHSAQQATSLPRALLPIVTGGAAVTAIVTVHFLWLGTLGDLIDATVLQLFGAQMEAFKAPYPPVFGPHPETDPLFAFNYGPPTALNYAFRQTTLFGLTLSTPVRELAIRLSYGLPLLLLASIPFLWLATRHAAPERRRATRSIAILAPILFLGIFPQAIWSHLAYVLAPALLLAAPIGENLATYTAGSWGPARRILEAVALAIGALVLVSAGRIALDVADWFPEPAGVPGATLSLMPEQASALRDSVAFVESCSEPGDFIFVAPDIPTIYLVTGRQNPTPYALLIPGNVDGSLVVERLEQHEPRCVVYNPRMYPGFPPFDELFPRVALYLLAHYEKQADLGEPPFEWQGLVRRK